VQDILYELRISQQGERNETDFDDEYDDEYDDDYDDSEDDFDEVDDEEYADDDNEDDDNEYEDLSLENFDSVHIEERIHELDIKHLDFTKKIERYGMTKLMPWNIPDLHSKFETCTSSVSIQPSVQWNNIRLTSKVFNNDATTFNSQVTRSILKKWREKGSFVRFLNGDNRDCSVNNLRDVTLKDALDNIDSWTVDWDLNLTENEKDLVRTKSWRNNLVFFD
jgi:hypothetical protein